MRILQRALTAVAAVSVLALSVTGCSGDSSSDGGRKVRFGYISDYNGASLLAIADKQGLWKEQGLSPDYKVFTNGPLQIQALGSGDLDFGYIGPGAMWLPASGKAKVVAVNTLARADRVIAQPGIDSIQDLKGKKVGVPEGTSGEMALNLALQKAGMSEKDVEKVPMDPSTVVSAFVSGQIDGAGLWYPLIDTIKARKPGLKEVASTADFTDKAFPTAFVSPAKADKELTTKVVKVLQKANDWRAAHPEESVDAAAGLLKIDRKAVAADAANVETLSTGELVAKTKDGTVGGWLDGLGEFFVGTGQLPKAPASTTYYEGDLYTEAYGK
ncbi:MULTISPECIES: aliphatic sulfonate ABC transporter substrate-binding protein [unclassified Streptomyces]|uniref:aliphatic sulfonate ABC transporter substrate-binding protein n=1 Tax=unclassified Streptomyces TaxID=2593676 RepID=UPI0001C1B5DD|nr:MULTISPECIES: aliphatic sulfonate ABC transporter substrate-binding protein [unclassified Streptomyces]AEN08499.1 aliphatic sulfonates family ABC transporter, periplasmic ligand-binding protein [Streptomyces sp. SirexAA-E]MYR69430.1 aliphatic sulfonate ABC transporter substrate-binding protein [Streptomyces sp. SID4939]MYS03343.1 aliphatic sulfonate ABC transporter substrate-binding protein [Streptomyces sp. SID4940]MYT66356.1 aliphatic sulfonate ABC transporter substrate-binding protein [St